jgi:predicted HTH domain antitoxin
MTLVLELPDSWKNLLGLDAADAAGRARQMLVMQGYREGRLSRGQVAEMLGLSFHEAEALLKKHGAEQQPTFEELEASGAKLRGLLNS